MRKFDEALNEAVDHEGSTAVSAVNEVLRELVETREKISELERKQNHLIENLIAQLGAEVRKYQPRMQIGLNNGACGCSYRTKKMTCTPNFKTGMWDVSGDNFAKRFAKKSPHMLKLNDDIKPLASAIGDYFNSKYKTLVKEDIGKDEDIDVDGWELSNY